MDFTPPFGQWLKAQRAQLDLTQADLARRIGYSAITLRKVEAGALKPSKQMLDLLADHLDVPASQRDAFVTFALGQHAPTAHVVNNLPLPMTALVGREKDVAAVCKLLDVRGRGLSAISTPPPARIVTLIGTPGVGKTRLALEAARQLAGSFANGVCWVELAPVVEPQTALAAIAQALGLEAQPGKPALQLLQEHLRDKAMLLVLDNLEQVLDVAPFIEQVLSAAPQVTVLCTSRELLRIAGEHTYPVNPLGDEAAQLFAQRAQAVSPHFSMTQVIAPTILEICRNLDGLPLAIELAAARINLFTPKEMLGRLNQRLQVLTGGARDLPARQRTLRATLEWSYSLLSADEQALFRRLGVFAGGCTLHAVKTFLEIDNDLALTAEDGLAALTDKSLLMRRADDNVEPRYYLLETMREFALEKLKQHGEHELWMERLGWYLVVKVELPTQPLVADTANMQFILHWAQSAPAVTEMEMMLAGAYGLFAAPRNNEELNWVARTFERDPLHPMPEARAHALFGMGLNYMIAGEHLRACRFFEDSLQHYRALGWPLWIARAANHAGHNARERGDAQRARALEQEALHIMRKVDPDAVPFMLTTLAGIEILDDNAEAAQRALVESERCLAQSSSIDPMTKTANHAWNLNHMGQATALRGRHHEARDLYRHSLETIAGHDHQNTKNWCRLWCHQQLAESGLALLDTAQARQDAGACLSLYQDFGDKMALAWCLATLAGVCMLDEEPERGARLWGASEALRARIGCRIAPASRLNRERTVALLREQLGEAELARLAAAGAKMNADEAVAFALEGLVSWGQSSGFADKGVS
jgi:predicted ATPase/transcriptional regulator with XRE-family HTH domain